MIGQIITVLILAEIFYILFCRYTFSSKGEFQQVWIVAKLLSIGFSMITVFFVMNIIYLIKAYLESFLLCLVGIIVIGLFIYANYRLGKAVCPHTNKKRRSKR